MSELIPNIIKEAERIRRESRHPGDRNPHIVLEMNHAMYEYISAAVEAEYHGAIGDHLEGLSFGHIGGNEIRIDPDAPDGTIYYYVRHEAMFNVDTTKEGNSDDDV